MKNIFQNLWKMVKPFQLISGVMAYLLGAGLVQYVRGMNSWTTFIEGAFLLVFTYLSVEGLRLLFQMRNPNNWQKDIQQRDKNTTKIIIGLTTATFLTVFITIIINWIQVRIMWQGLAFLLTILFTVSGFYYFAQIESILKPFEILIEPLLFIVIPSALGFFLQSSDLHNLLTMVVIALIPGYISNRLLDMLKNFETNDQLGVTTIVSKIGWEQAMVLHNALIFITFFLFALMALIGFPWFLLWPVFLSFPIGLLQIWLMEKVRRGAKPLWVIMQVASACILFIPTYLLAFAFWVR